MFATIGPLSSSLLRPFLLLTALLFAVGAQASPVHTGTSGNTAVGGYDAVAYHTQGKPVKGSTEFVHEWSGARWQFASAEHRDAFIASPAKYAPQFGGYCAWAMAEKNQLAPSDPQQWAVVDGRLFLNYNADVAKLWNADRPGLITKADANWPAHAARK